MSLDAGGQQHRDAADESVGCGQRQPGGPAIRRRVEAHAAHQHAAARGPRTGEAYMFYICGYTLGHISYQISKFAHSPFDQRRGLAQLTGVMVRACLRIPTGLAAPAQRGPSEEHAEVPAAELLGWGRVCRLPGGRMAVDPARDPARHAAPLDYGGVKRGWGARGGLPFVQRRWGQPPDCGSSEVMPRQGGLGRGKHINVLYILGKVRYIYNIYIYIYAGKKGVVWEKKYVTRALLVRCR